MVTNGDGGGTSWDDIVVSNTTGGQVRDGAWGESEFVQFSLDESLEGVGLLVSDPSLVVLVEVVPGILEVGVQVGWDLVWLEEMGGLKSLSGGELGIILHEEFLTSLVSGGGKSLAGELGVDVIEDLILVSSVVSRDVHILVDGLVNVSSEWVRVVGKFDGAGGSEESGNSK